MSSARTNSYIFSNLSFSILVKSCTTQIKFCWTQSTLDRLFLATLGGSWIGNPLYEFHTARQLYGRTTTSTAIDVLAVAVFLKYIFGTVDLTDRELYITKFGRS
jgi:hypothetical protein